MAKKLPYFKFDVESWLSGKIQLLPVREVGIFINLVARIWQNGGCIRNSDFLHRMVGAEQDVFRAALDLFLAYDLIFYDKDLIRIKFIDEQLAERESCIEANRRGGINSAIARAVKSTLSTPEVHLKSTSSTLKVHRECTSSIKIREDNIEDNKESNINNKEKNSYAIPKESSAKSSKAKPESAQEVIEYCKSRNNGIDGQFFWDRMEARGWTFKDGRPVKDWKACVRTWEKYNAEHPEEAASQSKNTRATYPGDDQRGKEKTNGF